jgi:hypothetical protein
LAAVEKKDHQQTVQNQGRPLLLVWATMTLRFCTGESVRMISDGITDFDELHRELEYNQNLKAGLGLGGRNKNGAFNPKPVPRPPWVTR